MTSKFAFLLSLSVAIIKKIITTLTRLDKYVCIRGRKYLNTTFRKTGKWNETNEHQDKMSIENRNTGQ